MTAMIEKTKAQLLEEFNAWYEEREREEERGGRVLTWDEVQDKVQDLGVEDELTAEAVAWARSGK